MSTTSRPHGLAKYQHVAAVLRDRIRSGVYGPGEHLPSEAQLDEEFPAYDRSTIRRGLLVLRQEGLIATEQGKGSFVRQVRLVRHPLLEVLRAEHQHAQEGSPHGLFERGTGVPEDDTQVDIEYTKVDADADLAEAFGVAAGTELLRRAYAFVVDGGVHQITHSYLLWAMVDGTPVADPANERPGRGTLSQLRSLGVIIDHVSVDISARMPSPDEGAELNCPTGIPVLIDRRRSLSAGRVVCVADTITPADRIAYGVDVELEEG